MVDPRNICILGAGNWGTTLAVMLAGNGHNVRLWEFRRDAAQRITADRENKEFLPGIAIPPQELSAYASDPRAAVPAAEAVAREDFA